MRFDHLQAVLGGQGQHGAAGDAVQAGGDFRGVDHAILYDEDVLARALGHIAFGSSISASSAPPEMASCRASIELM